MRKIALIAILLFSISFVASAQVKPYEGTLSEAKAKAKAENKQILIMCSTTW